MLTESEVAEIRELLPLAAKARRLHSPESAPARASARVSALLVAAHASPDPTPVAELARQTGISYHSVARRIRRATGAPLKSAPETAPPPEEKNPPSARPPRAPDPFTAGWSR